MEFRTLYTPSLSELMLSPEKPIALTGSCFTQNMAVKMKEHGWDAVNPCGTLYNPLSISIALDMMTDKENGEKRFYDSLFSRDEIWNSRWFDSSFSSRFKDDCIAEFKMRATQLQTAISAGQAVIITFGTSICYFMDNDNSPVGNCHKQPASLFRRRRLSITEITNEWRNLIERLRKSYPDLNFIFTVSPVRHLKDGFEGNSRSKAILQLAIEELCDNIPGCYYFPAFEILNDDLRDYRFYAEDLVHPSQIAVEYIWEKFIATFVDEEGKKLLNEGNKKFKAQNHRQKTGALGKPLSPLREK